MERRFFIQKALLTGAGLFALSELNAGTQSKKEMSQNGKQSLCEGILAHKLDDEFYTLSDPMKNQPTNT